MDTKTNIIVSDAQDMAERVIDLAHNMMETYHESQGLNKLDREEMSYLKLAISGGLLDAHTRGINETRGAVYQLYQATIGNEKTNKTNSK